MSERLALPDPQLEDASAPAHEAGPPVLSPSDPIALVAMIGNGLAPDASPATREAAWEVWQRFSPMIAGLARSQAASAPTAGGAATATSAPPLRLTPEQLGDMLIEKLRARLPAGTTPQVPRGFQVQLLPPHLR